MYASKLQRLQHLFQTLKYLQVKVSNLKRLAENIVFICKMAISNIGVIVEFASTCSSVVYRYRL